MNWIVFGTALWLLGAGALAPLVQLGLSTGLLRPTTTWYVGLVFASISSVAELIGAWKVTWAEPRTLGMPLAPDARTLARVLLTAGLLLTCALWRPPVTISGASSLIRLIPRLATLSGWICLYIYLTRLARRVPDVRLVRLTCVAIAAMALEYCLGSAFHLWLVWAMPAMQASMVPMLKRLSLSIWLLSLANTILVLVVQILYRRRFGQARQQSRREQSAGMPPQDTIEGYRTR
jgi:hypothetical protein